MFGFFNLNFFVKDDSFLGLKYSLFVRLDNAFLMCYSKVNKGKN